MTTKLGAAEMVQRVIAYMQQAKLGEWVTYASGQPHDRRHPVAALVHGWQRQGLVELGRSETPEGKPLHQFRRLPESFPVGWFDEIPAPAEPPARRDPEAVGIAMMGWWASEGDERPEWLGFAADHYHKRLGELLARIEETKLSGALAALPADAEAILADVHLLLITVALMLDPAGETPQRLKVVRRTISKAERVRAAAKGKKLPRSRMTHRAARAEHAAAHDVEKAVAAGIKRASAARGACGLHGVGESHLNARLASRAALRRLPADSRSRAAAALARSLQEGGLLQTEALALASEVSGASRTDIRKAIKSG